MTDAEMAAMQAEMQKAQNAPQSVTAGVDAASEAGGAAVPPAMHGDEGLAEGFVLADFLGNIHPAAVHFPIALFLVAVLAELCLMLRPGWALEPTVRFLVLTGAAGGIVAAILGWFAGGWRLSDRSETLGLHRWTGTGIAIAGMLAAVAVLRAPVGKAGAGRTGLRILLALIAVAVVLQGYWGAEMSMGPNHMGMGAS